MAIPALKTDDLTILPPSFDLAQAMSAVRTLKDFERTISTGEIELRKWRLDTQKKLREGSAKLEQILSGQPKELVAPIVTDAIDKVLVPLDELLGTYSEEFFNRPEVAAQLKIIASSSGPAGRFLRKQVQRVEEMRIANYNAIVDMRLALVALKSEFDPDGERVATFEDAPSLGSYLRSLTAG